VGEVEVGVYEERARRQHLGLCFEGFRHAHDVGERRVAFGTAMHAADDDRRLCQRHRWTKRSVENPEQEARATLTGAERIAVRIRLPGQERVGRHNHGFGHMSVEIERRDDRHTQADQVAYGLQEIPFDVARIRRRRRAMQNHENSVEVIACLEAFEHFRLELRIAVRGQWATGPLGHWDRPARRRAGESRPTHRECSELRPPYRRGVPGPPRHGAARFAQKIRASCRRRRDGCTQ
jgi:hypothetical protein